MQDSANLFRLSLKSNPSASNEPAWERGHTLQLYLFISGLCVILFANTGRISVNEWTIVPGM